MFKNIVIWLLLIFSVAIFFNLKKNKLSINFFYNFFLPYKENIQVNNNIEFIKSYDGHFYIDAKVNGTNIKFLFDTGATDIILSQKDAINSKINLNNIKNFKIYETARGKIKAPVVQIYEFKIGNFLINNIKASVNTHSMSHSLLGMSLLKYFYFTIKDNKLILYHKPKPNY